MRDEPDSSAPSGSLAEELHRTQPFRSPSQEAVIQIMRVSDLLRRHLGRLVDQEGITLQQFNVLRILRGAESEGLPTLEIGERMIEQTPGVTRLLDRLESAGLVERERGTRDRRRVWVRITDKGLSVLARLDQPFARAEDAPFAPVSEENLVRMIDGLDEVRRSLEQFAMSTRRAEQGDSNELP